MVSNVQVKSEGEIHSLHYTDIHIFSKICSIDCEASHVRYDTRRGATVMS